MNAANDSHGSMANLQAALEANFIKWLNRCFIERLIADFWYVTMDQSACKRQTISYELFEDGKWLYDSSEHIKRLHRILDS